MTAFALLVYYINFLSVPPPCYCRGLKINQWLFAVWIDPNDIDSKNYISVEQCNKDWREGEKEQAGRATSLCANWNVGVSWCTFKIKRRNGPCPRDVIELYDILLEIWIFSAILILRWNKVLTRGSLACHWDLLEWALLVSKLNNYFGDEFALPVTCGRIKLLRTTK